MYHDSGRSRQTTIVPPIALGVDRPALGIAQIGGRGGGHQCDLLSMQHRRPIRWGRQSDSKPDQIGRRGQPSAVRVHPGNVQRIGVLAQLPVVDDLVCQTLGSGVPGNSLVADPAWGEDGVSNKRWVRHGADFFDNPPQQAADRHAAAPPGDARPRHRRPRCRGAGCDARSFPGQRSGAAKVLAPLSRVR